MSFLHRKKLEADSTRCKVYCSTSRETEGINREMEEQIMPSILKKDNEWISKGKKIIEMEDIEEAIAANPEWSKDIENMQAAIDGDKEAGGRGC